MAKSRRVVSVRHEDKTAGSKRLWAYGMQWMANLGGLSNQRVRVVISNSRGTPPAFDASDPVAVVAWALDRRGHRDLAQAVRDALSPCT